MALENCPLSSLLELDNTYATRLTERRNTLATQRHEVLGVKPEGRDAVLEFYQWMMSVYLPGRWPMIYTVEPEARRTKNEQGASSTRGLRNTVTGELLPLETQDAEVALEIMGRDVDTEFLLLLPSSPSSTTATATATATATTITAPSESSSQPTYHLVSYINTSPAGFSTRSKLGLSLSAIHGPVPSYGAKLEKSMDRFFARLPVGKVVKSVNWSVSMTGEFFCLKGAHGVVVGGEQEQEQAEGKEAETVDLKTTYVRCERQTLHRLPQTGAVVFAFKVFSSSTVLSIRPLAVSVLFFLQL